MHHSLIVLKATLYANNPSSSVFKPCHFQLVKWCQFHNTIFDLLDSLLWRRRCAGLLASAARTYKRRFWTLAVSSLDASCFEKSMVAQSSSHMLPSHAVLPWPFSWSMYILPMLQGIRKHRALQCWWYPAALGGSSHSHCPHFFWSGLSFLRHALQFRLVLLCRGNCNCNWRICSAPPTISPMAHYTVKIVVFKTLHKRKKTNRSWDVA